MRKQFIRGVAVLALLGLGGARGQTQDPGCRLLGKAEVQAFLQSPVNAVLPKSEEGVGKCEYTTKTGGLVLNAFSRKLLEGTSLADFAKSSAKDVVFARVAKLGDEAYVAVARGKAGSPTAKFATLTLLARKGERVLYLIAILTDGKVPTTDALAGLARRALLRM